MKRRFTLFLLVSLKLFTTSILYSQSENHKEDLLKLSDELSFRFKIKKAEALTKAAQLGIPVSADSDAVQGWELMWFDNGRPVYFITDNAEGAQLIRADRVYPGGAAGLNLTGAGRTVGIWDRGRVRETHQEFGNRVTQQDGASNPPNHHATHVAGTMVASGVVPAARGIAYMANLFAWDWDNDTGEMAAAAADGLNNSQHAYSLPTGWLYGNQSGFDAWHWHGDPSISETEDYGFGFYGDITQLWDQIAYNAPNYLIVKSAGNTRGLGPTSGTGHYVFQGGQWTWSTTVRPVDGGEDGYDCISWRGNAKNIITVGALTGQGQMSGFSSWGPTDDGRIKPDLVAKGLDVYSTEAGFDQNYQYNSGTSMASSMVSGAIGLLLHHQENLNTGVLLRAATIKGLLIHSADDQISGAPGPDYRYGWGLVDVEAAAGIMSSNQATSGLHMYELTLNDQQQISIPVQASGSEPLRATIVWTDIPGESPAPSLNPPTSMLVNDLDLRIEDASSINYFPYTLNPATPAQPAATGDNFRDNVEMVHIESPAGGAIYDIVIRHKGTLSGGSQNVTLIITGNESISAVANPQIFTATAAGIGQINLLWNKNEDEDDIMVVWAAVDVFGIPEDGTTYTAGQTIPGGGTVLYRGGNLSFSHTGLSQNTTYYYRAFSYKTNNEYSSGISANATTDCGIVTMLPFSENFDASTSLPDCWEIVDNQGNGQVWQIGTHNEGLSGTTGNYAFLNSDAYGEGNTQNSDLITPILDLTAYTDVQLSFTHYFRQWENVSVATLYYSINGGSNWTQLQQWTATTLNPATYQQIIPALAGQSNVRFRWNYTGTWGYYWDIDNVLITGTFNLITTTWTGVEDNDWHNSNNWDVMVPAVYTDAVIPAGLTNYPTISSNAVCRNLTLVSSQAGNATILGDQNLSVDQAVTVERYIPAADWQVGSDGWHFLSSPVEGQLVSPAFTTSGPSNNYDFYAWTDENVPSAWLNQKMPENNITHLTVGQGYMVAYEQTDTKTFSGDLNTGNVAVPVSFTNSSNWSGWNLIGNPYPSAIDWNLAEKTIFQDNYAYVYNTNKPGGAGYVSITGIIPAHQGFFVRAGQSGQFTFTDDIRVHGGAWMKSGDDNKIVLRLSNDSHYDESTIMIREGSTNNRDRMDALKLFSFNQAVPQIYSLTADQVKVDINSIPAFSQIFEIPVAIFAPENGQMSLSLNNASGAFSDVTIKLFDHKTEKWLNLSQSPIYVFDALTTDNPERFMLKFEMVGVNDIPASIPVEIYAIGKALYINNMGLQKCELRIHSIAGQLVFADQIKPDFSDKLMLSLPAGWYMASVIFSDGIVTQKIFLN